MPSDSTRAPSDMNGRRVPLYYQLADWLRERIDSGAFTPGDKLPSASQLSKTAQISRMTVRQAIAHLERQGVLVVRPGVGTFVAEPKLTHDNLHVLGFTEEMLRLGRKPSSRVLEQGLIQPSNAVASALHLRADERVLRIVRLRFSGSTPMLLEFVQIPEQLVPNLVKEELSQASMYTILTERFGIALSHAQQTVEVTTATPEEARLLELPSGANLLLVEGTTYASNWRPVEAFKALYRGDKFKLLVKSWNAEPRTNEVSILVSHPE